MKELSLTVPMLKTGIWDVSRCAGDTATGRNEGQEKLR